MINILICLAIAVLAIFVFSFLVKATLLVIGFIVMLKEEYDSQKQFDKWKQGKK